MEKSISCFTDSIKEKFDLKEVDIHTYSPLTLAYIGDGAYELVVRTFLVGQGNCPVQKLHKKASQLVKAKAQSEMAQSILEDLTEEEKRVYMRGRNAKSFTVAKNATMADYRRATGFEALMGFLYLKKDMDRMLSLIKIGMQRMQEQRV